MFHQNNMKKLDDEIWQYVLGLQLFHPSADILNAMEKAVKKLRPPDSNVLVQLNIACGYGCLSGLFVCTKTELDGIYGKHIYFGEVLGKHSEISETMSDECLTVVCCDQDFIKRLGEHVMTGSTLCGYNPFDYLDEDD